MSKPTGSDTTSFSTHPSASRRVSLMPWRQQGLSIQRWDVSHRPASDGKFYDWFARLRFKGTHDEVMSLVGSVFSRPAAAADGWRVWCRVRPHRPVWRISRHRSKNSSTRLSIFVTASMLPNAKQTLLRERLAAAPRGSPSCQGTSIGLWSIRSRCTIRSPNLVAHRSSQSTLRPYWRSSPTPKSFSNWRLPRSRAAQPAVSLPRTGRTG